MEVSSYESPPGGCNGTAGRMGLRLKVVADSDARADAKSD